MNNSALQNQESWGQLSLAEESYFFSGSRRVAEDNPFISKEIEAEFSALEKAGIEALREVEKQ